MDRDPMEVAALMFECKKPAWLLLMDAMFERLVLPTDE